MKKKTIYLLTIIAISLVVLVAYQDLQNKQAEEKRAEYQNKKMIQPVQSGLSDYEFQQKMGEAIDRHYDRSLDKLLGN